MNPSQIAAQAHRIAELCNLAAKIANGQIVDGGKFSDGEDAFAIGQNGAKASIDIDLDHAAISWSLKGKIHSVSADTDILSNPVAAIVKQNDVAKTQGFPDASDDPSDAEYIRAAAIVHVDGDNANPAVLIVCESEWSAESGDSISDADLARQIADGGEYVRLADFTIERPGGAANNTLKMITDESCRLNMVEHAQLDLSKV